MATDTRLDHLDSSALLKDLLPLLREGIEELTISPIIIDILEVIVTDLTALQGKVQALQDAGHAAADELATLAAKVTSLQQAGAENVTQADIDALAESVSGVTNALSTATDSAATTSTPSPGVSDPSGVGGGTAAPTGGPTSAPEPSEQSRTVYTYDGDQTAVSGSVWPATGQETTDSTPKPVYFFINDTQNPDGSWSVNGVGAGFTQYTGDTQPAGTGSAGTDATATQEGSDPAAGVTPAPGAETGTNAPGAPTPRSSEGADLATAPDPASGGVVENTVSEPGQPPQAEPDEGWSNEPGPDQISPGG